MPRLIANVKEGEPCEIGGLRVSAVSLRRSGRRIRVVIDIPPAWTPRPKSNGSSQQPAAVPAQPMRSEPPA